MRNNFLLITCILLISICYNHMAGGLIIMKPAAASDWSDNDSSAVMRAQINLFTTLKSQNALKLNDHYVPEVTRFHQEGGLDVGWTPDRAVHFQDMFDGGLTLILEDWEIVDLRVYGDTALTAGYAKAGWQDADGRGSVEDIRFTYVWVRTEHGWREAHHHVSNLDGELRF
ncbi:MAG: DUF4440 domain-containing protein [Pseudomonadota bacterium]